MAKQSGLHQIRGKVGEHSYYKQSGVASGLIRSINQGMSSRVKTAVEYANTRLNNSEFKNANAIASFLYNAVPNRKASMMRLFAIAEMTKRGLVAIKDGTGQWGNRIPTEVMDSLAVDLLENHAKSGSYQGEFGLLTSSISVDGQYEIALEMDDLTRASLTDKGIDGFYALSVRGALAEVVDTDGLVRQHFGVSSVSPHDIDPTDDSTDVVQFTPSYSSLGMSPAGYLAAQSAANNGMYAIITFVPYRQVGSQRHTLYEYATYASVALGAIPTA